MLYGLWLPFDDRTPERFANFQSTLSLLEAELKNNSQSIVIFIGDFNSDLDRSNRYDQKLKNFVISNKLTETFDLFDQVCNYTYTKAEYRAKIDHIFVNEEALLSVEFSSILEDGECLSDHKAVKAV